MLDFSKEWTGCRHASSSRTATTKRFRPTAGGTEAPTLAATSLLGANISAQRSEDRAETFINNPAGNTLVPVDAVTASGSGVDPHISVANARLQADRVAEERDMDLADVLALIDDHTSNRSLGFLGEKGVNVLELNLALDRVGGAP